MLPKKADTERAIKKYTLTLYALQAPVALYKATDLDKVPLSLFHEKCGSRANQGKMECRACATTLESNDISKGVDNGQGGMIAITEEDLESCYLNPKDEIEITSFVHASGIDPIMFESAVYVAPQSGGEQAFELIRKAMLSTQTLAVANLRNNGRQATAVLRPTSEGIILHYLYYDYEVRNCTKWKQAPVRDRDVSTVASIITNMVTDDSPVYRKYDIYAQRLRNLIAAKIKKEVISPEPKKKPVPRRDSNLEETLQEALKQSATS